MSIERMNRKNRHQSRIRILISILVLMSVFFLAGCSQPKVYRVGILSGLNLFADTTDGFIERMTELGYKEGKNIIYDVQYTDFDMAAYDRILKNFLSDKVDLIFAFPTEAAIEAKNLTRDTGIPVIFANAFTEDMGLVKSVQEPGGNITGVRWPGPEIVLKGFTIMQELVPDMKRILVPYQKGYPIVKSQLDALRPAASSAGITVIELPASDAHEFEAELQKLAGPFDKDVIQLLAEPLIASHEGFAILSAFAAKYKMFIGGGAIVEAEVESVFSFIPELSPQGRQAANMADKIFKGTPAGTILVATAPYLFQFNYKQAQRLGIEVSEDILSQADLIIR